MTLSASDNNGAAGVTMWIYIDGALKASGSGSTMTYTWNTRKAGSGVHTIQAVARDTAGNTTNTQAQVTSR